VGSPRQGQEANMSAGCTASPASPATTVAAYPPSQRTLLDGGDAGK